MALSQVDRRIGCLGARSESSSYPKWMAKCFESTGWVRVTVSGSVSTRLHVTHFPCACCATVCFCRASAELPPANAGR
eukprot:4524738-Pleurochrysis_carterae.AAC.2